jgi:hypothetical protein
VAGGSAIRGSRVGSGPMGESNRGPSAPHRTVVFYCANAHQTPRAFSEDAEVPELWDCVRCGCPAGQHASSPPPAHRNEPYKSHLAYVQQRRTDADGHALLEEALTRLRARRGEE